MSNLSPTPPGKVAKIDSRLVREMREIADGRLSDNTKRAYRSDFKDFALFCRHNSLKFLPASPESVIAYLTFLARHAKWSTIKRRVAAITVVHRAKGFESPVDDDVKAFLKGVKRKVGEKVERKKPLLTKHVKEMLDTCGDDLAGARDKVIVLFGFSSWLRAENLAMLEVEDIRFYGDNRMTVFISKEKQDQTRKGRKITMGGGAVGVMKSWLNLAGISSGRVLRSIDRHGNINGSLSYEGMRLILKKYALKIGLNPVEIGMHSLRAGGVTQAIENNMPFDVAMEYGNWRSAEVFKGYVRRSKQILTTEFLGV